MKSPCRSFASRAFLLVVVVGASLVPASARERSPFEGTSQWWPEVREVDELLRAGKWKPARRIVQKLADKVVGKSWHGPDLDRVLGELALARAVAEANLRNDREAVWYWHMACNLSFRVRTRDLAGYGRAGKLLYEHRLRRLGETPAGFEDREVHPLIRYSGPKAPKIEVATILNNTGAARESPGDFHSEVLVDKEGRLHHPVVKSTHLHPVVIYAVLEWMLKLPPFEPRVIEGEVTDSLYPVSVAFRVSRW